MINHLPLIEVIKVSVFLCIYLGFWREHDLREVMLREDDVVLVVFSSASTEAAEKTVRGSPADFLGEAKRLSGRICSKLLT
jgi:hypothetical protein